MDNAFVTETLIRPIGVLSGVANHSGTLPVGYLNTAISRLWYVALVVLRGEYRHLNHRVRDVGDGFLPETTDEEEAVRILRALPYHFRQVAVGMLRGMHAEYARGPLRPLQEGDRVRVVLVQEGTVVGEAEEPDHYLVSIDGSRGTFHVGELIEVEGRGKP